MSSPIEATLDWAAAQLSAPILAAEPMGGGITRTKWLLRLAAAEPVVLRWSDPAVWGDVGREHVRREALALDLLTGSKLPVPHLLAVDLDRPDGPTALLSFRSGSVRLDRLSPAAIAAVVEVAVAIHRHPVAAGRQPPTVSFRGPAEPEVPDWAHDPGPWRAGIDLRRQGPPGTTSGLLHRDFHFGNLVWQGDVVSGVVDWAETSWGPPELDVAHLCSDLAMLHAAPQAASFRAAYRSAGGELDEDAQRFWQVADILGFLPDPAHILPGLAGRRPDLDAPAVRTGLETLLALTLR